MSSDVPDKVQVVFRPEAAIEFREAKRWYLKQAGVDIATAFEHEVNHAISQIADSPNRWPVYLSDFRLIILKRFPYLLPFALFDEMTVVVMAVAHEKRVPGYWIHGRTM